MKKLKYHFPEGSDLSKPFTFQYGPERLADFSEVEIIPVSVDGKQIAKSIFRQVVLVNHDEDGNNWYEASTHVNLD